ncbi:MAG: caspase family protein [Chthoniobacterales bacterium]
MRRAICIGVGAHSDSQFQNIAHCLADARRLAEFCREQGGFDVLEVANPTCTTIRESIWQFIANLEISDQLLVYFSGHGRRNSKRKLQLCMADSVLSSVVATSLSFDNLLELLGECKAGAVLIILDCCFSGAAASSILQKGEDDSLVAHEDLIHNSRGLAVLSSCNSIEVSCARLDEDVSIFTGQFLELCKSSINSHSGWVTVAHLYGELKKTLCDQEPRLIGENPLFPVCKGLKPTHELGEGKHSAIHFEKIPASARLLLGVLVLPYFRCWLVAIDAQDIPQSAEAVAENIYAIYNDNEVFRGKLEEATRSIPGHTESLIVLSRYLGRPLMLLFPIALDEVTFNRFRGSDQKYIVTEKKAIPAQSFVPLKSSNLMIIGYEGEAWHVYRVPEDYIREAFGIIIDEKHEPSCSLLKEDSFVRNSKFLLVEHGSSMLRETHTLGPALIPGRELFTDALTDAATLNRFSTSYGFLGSNDKPVFVTPLGVENAACMHCADARFRTVIVNTRRYRVPCKFCNSGHDNSWVNFEGAEEASPETELPAKEKPRSLPVRKSLTQGARKRASADIKFQPVGIREWFRQLFKK